MILTSKGSFEAKINVLFNIFCLDDEQQLLTNEDVILMIKTSLYSIFNNFSIESVMALAIPHTLYFLL